MGRLKKSTDFPSDLPVPEGKDEGRDEGVGELLAGPCGLAAVQDGGEQLNLGQGILETPG